jgi:cytochrome P450 family 2 subfamily K
MLTTLRDFGFGKSSMEDTINEEAKYFVEYMKSEKSKENILSVQVCTKIQHLST